MIKENKMGSVPIKKLIISMSLPMMISMLIQSLYNIIDSIFVAQVSEEALTAVSLAFPVQNMMIALQVGTGAGVSAVLARSLGAGRQKQANSSASNSVLLAGLHYGIFLVFGLLFSKAFFETQTSDPTIIAEGTIYLTIITTLSFGQFFQVTYERLMQSTGNTFHTMITQGIGAITNIILDPILIFGWFGFPEMGVAGAALATVIGQMLAAVLAVYFNTKKNTELSMPAESFRPNWSVIREIYSVGIPSTLMVAISSVAMFFLNMILMTFSATATAVYGIYFKLQSFIFMPVFGLTNGIMPILSYNYGARNKQRIIDTIKLGIVYSTVIMVVGMIVFQLIPEILLSAFNASEEMLGYGVPALRIISLNFIVAGYSIVISSVFQSFGAGVLSFGESLIRQVVVLIPVAYLFSLSGNIDMIWWAYPIAEIASGIYCTYFMYRIWIRKIKPIPEDGELPILSEE